MLALNVALCCSNSLRYNRQCIAPPPILPPFHPPTPPIPFPFQPPSQSLSPPPLLSPHRSPPPPPEPSFPPGSDVVVAETVRVTFEYINVNLDNWSTAPRADKNVLLEVIRRVFAEESGVNLENVFVYFNVRKHGNSAGLRVLQSTDTIVVNIGDVIVIIDLVIPPYTTSAIVKSTLEEDLLEVDENLSNRLDSETSILDLGNAVITSTIVSTKPVIASPPPPGPDNISPFTDQSLIFIVAGSCVGLFLFIVLARECDADMIRATRRLLFGSFDALTSVTSTPTITASSVEDTATVRQKKSVDSSIDIMPDDRI